MYGLYFESIFCSALLQIHRSIYSQSSQTNNHYQQNRIAFVCFKFSNKVLYSIIMIRIILGLQFDLPQFPFCCLCFLPVCLLLTENYWRIKWRVLLWFESDKKTTGTNQWINDNAIVRMQWTLNKTRKKANDWLLLLIKNAMFVQWVISENWLENGK